LRHLQPDLLDYLQEKKKYGQASWLFSTNRIEPFAYVETFNAAQCRTIIQIGKNATLEKSNIASETYNESVRKSNTSWLSPSHGNEWIFQQLTQAAMFMNEKFFKFDLLGFAEGIQFVEYESPGGKYDPHVDCMYDGNIRKLSISVQLSDGNDYEGGDVTCNYGNELVMPRTQGTALAFPSYALHGVKPVTKGTRYSLVAWITGPQFK
jgi:PKHD-type hydroxylase